MLGLIGLTFTRLIPGTIIKSRSSIGRNEPQWQLVAHGQRAGKADPILVEQLDRTDVGYELPASVRQSHLLRVLLFEL